MVLLGRWGKAGEVVLEEGDIINIPTGIFRGFVNVASPGVISLFLQNAHYASREDYMAALATALRDEYRTIIEAGLDLQLDCPDLALSRHMLHTIFPTRNS